MVDAIERESRENETVGRGLSGAEVVVGKNGRGGFFSKNVQNSV